MFGPVKLNTQDSLLASWALFRSPPNSKFFYSLSITLIFSCLHGVLNVGKKKLITQFSGKSRDESFKPSWSTIGQYLPNKMKVVLFIRFKKFVKWTRPKLKIWRSRYPRPVLFRWHPNSNFFTLSPSHQFLAACMEY